MFLWHLALAQASPEGVPKEGLYVHICWNSFSALATYQQGPRQVTSRTCPWTIWRRSHGPAAQSRYRSSSLRMVPWCIPQGEECGAYDEASWHFSTSSNFFPWLKNLVSATFTHLAGWLLQLARWRPGPQKIVRMLTYQTIAKQWCFWNT